MLRIGNGDEVAVAVEDNSPNQRGSEVAIPFSSNLISTTNAKEMPPYLMIKCREVATFALLFTLATCVVASAESSTGASVQGLG